jgi:hypothetical protein
VDDVTTVVFLRKMKSSGRRRRRLLSGHSVDDDLDDDRDANAIGELASESEDSSLASDFNPSSSGGRRRGRRLLSDVHIDARMVRFAWATSKSDSANTGHTGEFRGYGEINFYTGECVALSFVALLYLAVLSVFSVFLGD